MKATFDIPDDLYRQVKARSALEGRPMREVAIHLFQHWIEGSKKRYRSNLQKESHADEKKPSWFGALHTYSTHARGLHDILPTKH